MLGVLSNGPVRRAARVVLLAAVSLCALPGTALADRLHLTDGRVLEVDEAWEDAHGFWYKIGGVARRLERSRVSSVERAGAPGSEKAKEAAKPGHTTVVEAARVAHPQRVRIHFVGGAEVEAEEVTEEEKGFWFRRGNINAFAERARVARVERVERSAATAAPAAAAASEGERAWTTGKRDLDSLISRSAAAHGVDPYLIFCVMEQESHFNPRAVSPVGARGLMQLMPGTARRFGVRNVHDPAQNVSGGTRYLKELIGMFDGRVDLVLASYNAGEGAVRRYGQRVPPYAETRNYVKRIGARYGKKSVAGKATRAAPAAAGVEE